MLWGCVKGLFVCRRAPVKPLRVAGIRSDALGSLTEDAFMRQTWFHERDAADSMERILHRLESMKFARSVYAADTSDSCSTSDRLSAHGSHSDLGGCSGSSCASVAGEVDDYCCEDICGPAAAATPLHPDSAPSTLRVRVCSWNLYGNVVDAADDVTSWLGSGEPTDIYVVGVQELVELRPASVLASPSGDPGRQAALEERIGSAMATAGGQFVKVCNYGMVGLAILVFVRAALAPHVTDVRCDHVKTGFAGILGNKGGVSVHFRLGGFSACFVNVHLPSGQSATQKRDLHLSKIMSQVSKPCGGMVNPNATLQNFTVVFGDFNSRLDLHPGTSWPAGPMEDWLYSDQLLWGRFPSLEGFQEGSISFAPTFQYIPGTDDFSLLRAPAWCDRVVFQDAPGATAKLLEYESFMELRNTSDHRPVAAQFHVSLSAPDLFLGGRRS
mmetsp:Transcript_28675/g.78834  ORF Transcript_28675/g.78834 Transcript_28675/m.78834 type:complete len:442 (-) Transcript_28675:313-1638(-)